MKILNLHSGKVHEIDFKSKNENRLPCPDCSESRKNKKDPCFAFNAEIGTGFCHHCDSRFVAYKPHENKEFKKPEWINFTSLTDAQVLWFSKRMISQLTLQKMKISHKSEYFPQVQKKNNAICFPFFKSGELVNVKYRDGAKNFKLEQGAELVWYNFDALTNHKEIIIVEGEIDAISFIEDGFENVISVPNGASTGSMEYLDNSIDLFDKLDKVYIAVDVDEKGIKLRDELIRRIGSEKCFICGFSEFKDANEYLCGKGRKSLHNVIKNAKELEVEGSVNLSTKLPDIEDLFKNGLKPGLQINEYHLDKHISFEMGRLAIVTGTPSSGKSEFIDFVCTKLNVLHNLKICYWSPENYPLQYHYSKLAEKIIGKKFDNNRISSDDFWNSYEHIKRNFFWIDPEEPFLDEILKLFRYNIRKNGVNVVVLDPFTNMLDETDYTKQGKMLTKMSMFARQFNILFILIAHPRKLEKDKQGHFPMPSMYDISGSADFWNRADYGISLRREQNELNAFTNFGQIAIQKVKYKHLGEQGMIEFKYNYNNGRYVFDGANVDNWDNSNWLNNNNNNQKELPIINPESAFDEEPIKLSQFINYENDELPF